MILWLFDHLPSNMWFWLKCGLQSPLKSVLTGVLLCFAVNYLILINDVSVCHVGSLGMTVYGLPWLCLVLIPLIPVYHWLQNHYRLTSRELKRLSSVTLSPLYNHFNETLQGIVTIRAFRAIPRYSVCC